MANKSKAAQERHSYTIAWIGFAGTIAAAVITGVITSKDKGIPAAPANNVTTTVNVATATPAVQPAPVIVVAPQPIPAPVPSPAPPAPQVASDTASARPARTITKVSASELLPSTWAGQHTFNGIVKQITMDFRADHSMDLRSGGLKVASGEWSLRAGNTVVINARHIALGTFGCALIAADSSIDGSCQAANGHAGDIALTKRVATE